MTTSTYSFTLCICMSLCDNRSGSTGLVCIPVEPVHGTDWSSQSAALVCSAFFFFHLSWINSFKVSSLFPLTRGFLGLVNHYLVLRDLEISLTDNYNFTLMPSMGEVIIIGRLCRRVSRHERSRGPLRFLTAAKPLYSKPLKHPVLRNIWRPHSFITMLFIIDTKTVAPQVVECRFSSVHWLWKCLETGCAVGKGGSWSRQTKTWDWPRNPAASIWQAWFDLVCARKWSPLNCSQMQFT